MLRNPVMPGSELWHSLGWMIGTGHCNGHIAASAWLHSHIVQLHWMEGLGAGPHVQTFYLLTSGQSWYRITTNVILMDLWIMVRRRGNCRKIDPLNNQWSSCHQGRAWRCSQITSVIISIARFRPVPSLTACSLLYFRMKRTSKRIMVLERKMCKDIVEVQIGCSVHFTMTGREFCRAMLDVE